MCTHSVSPWFCTCHFYCTYVSVVWWCFQWFDVLRFTGCWQQQEGGTCGSSHTGGVNQPLAEGAVQSLQDPSILLDFLMSLLSLFCLSPICCCPADHSIKNGRRHVWWCLSGGGSVCQSSSKSLILHTGSRWGWSPSSQHWSPVNVPTGQHRGHTNHGAWWCDG